MNSQNLKGHIWLILLPQTAVVALEQLQIGFFDGVLGFHVKRNANTINNVKDGKKRS